MTKIVFEYGGTFDKYLGDAIMAFFGAPVRHDDDAWRAVCAAAQMQRVFEEIVGNNEHRALRELGLGIGINTGEAIVGNIGSEKIMDYTVIGDTANVARRLQEIAGKGQILIGHRTFDRVKAYVVTNEAMHQAVKGREDQIVYYEVQRLL